jgi:hypothetical protein
LVHAVTNAHGILCRNLNNNGIQELPSGVFKELTNLREL